MSRIGKAPITVPDKVSVSLNGLAVTVKGPKGSSVAPFPMASTSARRATPCRSALLTKAVVPASAMV